MLVLLAEEFEGMGGEIDDQQSTALGDQARGFAHGGGGIGEVVQDLMDDHQVGALPRQAGAEDVAMAQLEAFKTGLSHMIARDVEHLLGKVEADSRLGVRPKQGQHPTGAGAEIHEPLERARPDGVEDSRLNSVFGNVERANLVPSGRVAREVLAGLRRTLAAHGLQPLGVANDDLVGRIDQPQGLVGQAPGIARGHEAIEHPSPIGEPLDQPGLGQQLEVTRDARLALVQHPAQFQNRQLLPGQQRKNPQPRRLARRAQNIHGLTRGERHERIKISLCLYVKQRR